MRLDTELIRYLSSSDMRVLLAIESKMRSNEMVPISQLIGAVRGGEGELRNVLRTLGKQTLTHQETGK